MFGRNKPYAIVYPAWSVSYDDAVARSGEFHQKALNEYDVRPAIHSPT